MQELHAGRSNNCTAVSAGLFHLTLANVTYHSPSRWRVPQVLFDVQQTSKSALSQLTDQLQQLHSIADAHHVPEGSAAQPLEHTAPNGSRQAEMLSSADFCSKLGFLAWARLCWEQQQQLLQQMQQLPAFYAELQLQVQEAVLSSPESQSACVRWVCRGLQAHRCMC